MQQRPVQVDGTLEEAPRSGVVAVRAPQEVDRLACLVDRAVEAVYAGISEIFRDAARSLNLRATAPPQALAYFSDRGRPFQVDRGR